MVGNNVQADATSSAIVEPTLSTIIDILSSEVEFSYFLRILQRKGLVPVINSLQNVTILAPVNLAFASHELIHIDEKELYRYIIDQRVMIGYMTKKPTIFNTLYKQNDNNNKSYPILISPDFDTLEYEVDKHASIVEFDIYAKHQWSFIQAIDQQLPVKPSMCDMLLDDSTTSINGHNITFVKGLFQLLFKPQYAANPQIDAKKKKHDKFKDIPTDCQLYLSNVSTVFLPTDDMLRSSMSSMLMRYYSALYHTLNGNRFTITDEAILEIKYDITELLNNLLISEIVGAANITKSSYASKNNQTGFIVDSNKDDKLITLNGKVSSSPTGSNLVYGDGVIHLFEGQQDDVNFFDDLNIELISMTPKKALFALHYSTLVSELEFCSLNHLIDGTTSNQTILLSYDQRDDVAEDILELVEAKDDADPITIDSFSLKQQLLYQFIEGALNITDQVSQDLSNTFYKLVDSMMCSKLKIHGCYKLKISSSFDDINLTVESRINDVIKVVSDPIDIGNGSIAYFVNKPIETPSSFKLTLADLLSNGKLQRHLEHIQIDQQECLKTIQYLSHFDLLKLKDNSKGYSIFLPCGIPDTQVPTPGRSLGAWKGLGLILNHLEKHPEIFKDIIKGIFVEGTYYSDFGLNDNIQMDEARTLRGDSVNITNQFFDGNYNHLLKINDSFIPIPLNSDLLFNQGVIHIIGNLLFPNDIEISFIDLLKATRDDEKLLSFLDLLDEFPRLKQSLQLDSMLPPYSLLVPTQESLNAYNITKHADDLIDLLRIHLIPNSELPQLFACFHSEFNSTSYAINSNSSKLSFSCSKDYRGKVMLSVNREDGEKSGHKVKILNQGCVRNMGSTSNQPCVFLIDKPIRPKWLDNSDGFLHIHLGIISIGIGIILGLIFFSVVTIAIIFYLGRKKDGIHDSNRKTPFNGISGNFMRLGIGEDEGNNIIERGYETDDDMQNERQRLLPDRNLQRTLNPATGNYGSTAPVSIKGSQSKKALNRSRNLPEV